MNPTNAYWVPSKWTSKKSFLQADAVQRGLGFWVTIPWPDPVTAGYYYGEGAVPDRRELSYETRPEMFAVSNVLTSSAGRPRFNPKAEYMKISREKKIVKS